MSRAHHLALYVFVLAWSTYICLAEDSQDSLDSLFEKRKPDRFGFHMGIGKRDDYDDELLASDYEKRKVDHFGFTGGIGKRADEYDEDLEKRKVDRFRFRGDIGKRGVDRLGFYGGIGKRRVDRFGFVGGIGKRVPFLEEDSGIVYEKLGHAVNELEKRSVHTDNIKEVKKSN